jgi:hypothetical protein
MEIELINFMASHLGNVINEDEDSRCAGSNNYVIIKPKGKDIKRKGNCYIYFDDHKCTFHLPELGTVSFKIKDPDITSMNNGIVTQTLINAEDNVMMEGFIMVQIVYGHPTKTFIINYPRCNDWDAYMFEAEGFAGSPLGNTDNRKDQHVKKKRKKEYDKMEKIFNNTVTANECFAALMKVNPPVIDRKFNYALGSRQKGSIIAWVVILKVKNRIFAIDDSLLIRLLNKKIRGLKLGKSARSLRNRKTTAYRKYYNQFNDLLT